MEETIGALWDKLVTKIAYTGYPEARVHLEQIAPWPPSCFKPWAVKLDCKSKPVVRAPSRC